MRLFTKWLCAVMLLCVAGLAHGERRDLRFSTADYCAAHWDAATNTFSWGSGGWNAAWTFVDCGVSGDITAYTKFHIKVENWNNASAQTLRVVFKENNGTNPPSGPTTEETLVFGSDGVGEIDLTQLDWTCDRTKLQDLTIYGCDRDDPSVDASVVIVEGWLETGDSTPEEPEVKGDWLSLINNGDAEGTDLESFPLSKDGPNNQDTADDRPEIVEGGVDGGHCFKVVSDEGATQTWSTQFFIRFKTPLVAGQQIRLSMDVRADRPQQITTSAQGKPRAYHGGFPWKFDVTEEWTTQTTEYTVTAGDAKKNDGWSDKYGNTDEDGFLSIAFDLNNDMENANTFYFDNIVCDLFSPMTSVTFNGDVLQVVFPYETNIATLVSNSGRARLMFPTDCFTVKVDGQEAPLSSVEADADGSLYIFLDEEWAIEHDISEDAKVVVSFRNPADEAFRIVYTDGVMVGQPAEDFTNVEAEFSELIDVLPYSYGLAELVSSDPEEGSFNLPNSIREFHFVFDKPVECSLLKGYLGKEVLAVSPATGVSKEVTLSRTKAGNLETGAYTVEVTNVLAENRISDDFYASFKVKFNVGHVEVAPDATTEDLIALSVFDDCETSIPEGFLVNVNGREYTSENAPESSVAGMKKFDKGVDFKRAFFFRNGFIEYGSQPEYELNLTEGGTYRVSFNSAMWNSNGTYMKFEVVDPSGKSVVNQIIKNAPNATGSTDATMENTTASTFKFVAEQTGQYILRWTSVNKAGKMGFNEVLLAKVHAYSMPSAPGWEETNNLLQALAAAKETIDAATGGRYDGPAFDALYAAVQKYDAEAAGYTAPTVIAAAIADLTAKTSDLASHRWLCDRYDGLNGDAQEIVASNEGSKFEATDAYAVLKATAAKYDGRELTDDAELAAAIADLENIVALGKAMFTEGESRDGDAGIKVLVERIRLGAETLQTLGVDEEDELLVAADNAVTDDDDLADQIKNRIKQEIYGRLKDGDTSLIDVEYDEDGNPLSKGLDMTVFVKNPNFYALQVSEGFSEENIPGWWAPIGHPGLFVSWGDARNIEGLPEDCAFTTYWGTERMEQTIYDLPAGVYTVSFLGTDWANQAGNESNPHDVKGFVYDRTSETLVPEEDEEEDRDLHFDKTATIEYAGLWQMNRPHDLEEIEVTDGQLTVGIHFAGDSQYFFSQIKLYLTAPAAGFDYAEAYTGVKTISQTADRNVYYDLQGRRVAKPAKGLYIRNGRKVAVK